MAQNKPDPNDQNPANSAIRVDRVCDAFEAEWKAGERPRIEDFLQSPPEGGRKDLFRELLLVELQWRHVGRESPGKDEYIARFPDLVAEIDLAFGMANAAAGPPQHPQRDGTGNDRNLLFGILAVQMDFISRDALVTAMNAWVLAKDKPLGEILVDQKALTIDRRTLLEALVQEHLKQHDNDPEKSLEAVSSLGPVREDLRQIADPGLQATLAHVAVAHPPADPGTTQTFAVGSATSAGTRFRILRPHAEGGLGKVSVARDEELSREVALKEIKALHADNPDSRARFLLEAEITGGLEHPGIVPVYGLGQYADGRPYYAMRFIRGDSLKEAVDGYHHPQAPKSNPGERAVELRKLLGRFLDVCNAIAYAHSRGVLHRDLKPGNIMLGKYGETLVVDWGLAKVVDRPEVRSESSELPLRPSSESGAAATQMGAALGTPQYMSPEQAAGRLDLLGPASDVYSLGATLYYVLTGQRPIDSDDIGTVLQKVERGDFRPPRAVNPEIARPLEAICLKAMALKCENRYASPRALADDIEHWLADEPVTAYREPLRTRAARWGRKHKTLVAGAFGLVTAAAIALAISTGLIKHEQILTEHARQQAATNAARADEKAREAQKEKTKAENEKNKAQRQLALSYIERGVNELEHGDPAKGFAMLGQAYRAANEANDVGLRRSICALLGAWRLTFGHGLGRADAVAFSPDGTKVATVSSDAPVRLWDAVTGQPLGAPMKYQDKMYAIGTLLAFSPDGTKVAMACRDMTARLWDAATGKPLGQAMKPDGSLSTAAFCPDGTKVATACFNNKTARLWDAATGRPLGAPMKHGSSVFALAFSPDGTKVATASDDMTAHLWDATTRRPLGPPMKHDDRVLDVVFSPDGAKVATASHDMTARLWDAATGRTLGPPMKHDARVVALAFSPDGTKVATASWDQTARLWDAATAQPLGPAMKHYGYVNAVTFSPDGTRVATASSDKAARLWPVPISLPDDPHWVNAYVDAISAWKEDADAVIHAISAAEADEAWFEVLKSRAWVDQRRQDAERRARAWHENEALTHEALGNWFAAAFHLRWLCQLEPKNTQWRERLAKAKERVAELERQQHANSQQRLASTKEDIAPPTLPTSSQLLTKDAQAGTWSPDGKKIAFAHAKPSDNGLRILTLATNTMEELAETGKDPAWAPGEGRLIAFTDKKAGDKEEGVWIVDLRSKQTKRVATGGFACWLADGKTVCYRTSVDGKVAVQSLDVTDDKATPKTLLTGVSFYPAVSPDGQYVAGFGNSELQIWSVAKQEIVDRHPLPGWGSLLPSWSPDSQQVGFGSFAGRDSNDGLWIYDLRTHRAKKLLAGPYTLPRWSADGKRMCVDKRGSGSKELWLLDLLPSVFSDSTPATEPSDRPREVRPSLESKKTPPLMDERPAEPPQSPGEKPQQAPKAGRPSPDLRR